jgi:hypothetical protein
MAFRIEWVEGHMRLSGQLRSEQLDQLRAAIDECGSRSVLDLTEVDLVDIEAIRFLNSCEARGVSVLNASGYVRAWMGQERERPAHQRESAGKAMRKSERVSKPQKKKLR